MKIYIVYVKGVERGYIRGANHNSAEKKAQKKFEKYCKPHEISVVYTEL